LNILEGGATILQRGRCFKLNTLPQRPMLNCIGGEEGKRGRLCELR